MFCSDYAVNCSNKFPNSISSQLFYSIVMPTSYNIDVYNSVYYIYSYKKIDEHGQLSLYDRDDVSAEVQSQQETESFDLSQEFLSY